MSGRRVASVKVYRPTHVPPDLLPVWNGAAQHLAKQNKLVTASGKVNYDAVNKQYQRLLGVYSRISSARSRTASVRIARPKHVPKELFPVYREAAQYLANENRLLTASGKVDHEAVNHQFTRALTAYQRIAARVK